MNVKKWAALVCTAVFAMSLLAGCGNSVSTKTQSVTKSNHPVALTLDANITALHMTNIVPKLSGKLVSTPLTVGQEVKAGQAVVQVDSTPYQQSVSDAEAQLVAASSPSMRTSSLVVTSHYACWHNDTVPRCHASSSLVWSVQCTGKVRWMLVCCVVAERSR